MVYVFVEGPDDERFFSKIYGEVFCNPKFIQYAGWTPVKINNFLRSIKCTNGDEYIFLGDADGKTIDEKKGILIQRYSNLDDDRLFIVQYEIESWYYAGVDQDSCQKLKLKQYIYNTDTLTKEQFNSKLPKKSERKFIMLKLLEVYELSLAIQRNNSLSIFDSAIEKEPA